MTKRAIKGEKYACPIEGCQTTRASPESIRKHLKQKHGMSARETWPLITPLKSPGGDWEQFKREFEALKAARPAPKPLVIYSAHAGGKSAAIEAATAEAERRGEKVLVARPDDRPACFGNCYELSSACSGCRCFNACRRVSQ